MGTPPPQKSLFYHYWFIQRENGCRQTDLLLIITSTADERKQGFLVNFWRFQAGIHILRLNCAETIQDRPRQPAYEMFGVKRSFNGVRLDPIGSRSPPYIPAHQICRASNEHQLRFLVYTLYEECCIVMISFKFFQSTTENSIRCDFVTCCQTKNIN